MALWRLASDYNYRGSVLRAGKLIDDAQYPLAQMQADGCVVVAANSTTNARAAVLQSMLVKGQHARLVDEGGIHDAVDVPAGQGGSAPTGTGFTHVTAGAQDAAARAVNLASADVTGVLGSANGGIGVALGSAGQSLFVNAAGNALQYASFSGDLSGSATTPGQVSVVQLTGSSGTIAIPTAANLQWALGVASPQILQAANTTDTACNNLTITPQAPFASATGTNRTPGNLVVSIAAPTNGSSVEGGLVVQRGGTFAAQIGMVPGNSIAGLYLGNAAPSSTNYILGSNAGNTTQFNAPGGGSLQFAIGASPIAQMTGAGWQGGNAGVPWKWIGSAVTFAASGTTTLTTTQQQTPLITLSTVTLTGAATLAFGNVTGFWLVDVSGIALGGQTLTFSNGTGSIVVSPLMSANKTLIEVICTANHIAAG